MTAARRLAPSLALVLAACAPAAGTAPPLPPAPAAAAAPAEAAPTPGDDLAEVVMRRLKDGDKGAFRAVSVRSAGATVMLTGAVTKPMLRRRAEAVAAAVPGVKAVYDALLLAEEAAFTRFLPDPGRERALAARLAELPDCGNVIIRVVDGAAYLAGTVPSAAALAQAKTALLEDPELKWVDTGAVAVR